MRFGLIASGNFLNESLSAELGRLPPCFVPLGSHFLLQRQCAELQNLVDRVYVSLPEGYHLHPQDRKQVEALGVHILYCDPTLRIGDAIANCVNTIGIYDHEILILYGDTIIKDIDTFPEDGVSVHPTWGEYGWADLDDLFGSCGDTHSKETLSGLFAFSNVPELLRSIVRAKGDFLQAIRLYNQIQQLALVRAGQWFDFGHVQTYFHSTGLVTTQRSFNSLRITEREVVKSSVNTQKICAEAGWFIDIPAYIRAFTPAFLGERKVNELSGYATANTYLSTLSQLAVFGDLQSKTWVNIFNACAEFLSECQSVNPSKPLHLSPRQYFDCKTKDRIDKFSQSEFGGQLLACRRLNGTSLPSLSQVMEVTDKILCELNHGDECLVHGDFCFSNIFYDFRSVSIKVIDPRGELPDGRRSIYGLQSYDFAKLAHSAIGGYDLIITGYISGQVQGDDLILDDSYRDAPRWQRLIEVFEASKISQMYSPKVRDAMLVHLFLSMLPMHGDRPDRQIAMLATAYKLFATLTER